jgi:hypothetical protein
MLNKGTWDGDVHLVACATRTEKEKDDDAQTSHRPCRHPPGAGGRVGHRHCVGRFLRRRRFRLFWFRIASHRSRIRRDPLGSGGRVGCRPAPSQMVDRCPQIWRPARA